MALNGSRPARYQYQRRPYCERTSLVGLKFPPSSKTGFASLILSRSNPFSMPISSRKLDCEFASQWNVSQSTSGSQRVWSYSTQTSVKFAFPGKFAKESKNPTRPSKFPEFVPIKARSAGVCPRVSILSVLEINCVATFAFKSALLSTIEIATICRVSELDGNGLKCQNASVKPSPSVSVSERSTNQRSVPLMNASWYRSPPLMTAPETPSRIGTSLCTPSPSRSLKSKKF